LSLVDKIFGKVPFAFTKNLKHGKLIAQVLKIVLDKEESSFVDVGCHKGGVLKIALRIAPKGEHFAFEAIPHYYEKLKPEFQNYVNLYNLAITNYEGESEFNFVESNPKLSGFKKRDYPKTEKVIPINVPTNSLDNLLKDAVSIDLIRIDVEGAEWDVLDGAKRTIFKHKPHILFEHIQGAADHYQNGPDKMWELLVGQLGMKINTLTGFLKKQKAFTKAHFKLLFNTGQETYFITYFD
jgi:FkbM family methyltransferase